jgi:hypothetical protein
MKPTAPLRYTFSVFATTPCRGLEGCTYRAMGRDDGEGAHSTGCLADTLAVSHVLRKRR